MFAGQDIADRFSGENSWAAPTCSDPACPATAEPAQVLCRLHSQVSFVVNAL